MATRYRERALDEAFRAHLEAAPDFVAWLLSRTKFSGVRARLVEEPWQFQWYKSQETGVESETDILLIFAEIDSGCRFALHIENKLANGKFRPNQPQLYRIRAEDWMKTRDYEDYELILIAPRSFYDSHREDASAFNRFIPYEDIAAFVPEFGFAAR